MQAAGFLKITGGENPLDATWIHPESYPYAEQILKRLDLTPEQLAARTPPARKPPEPVQPLPSETVSPKADAPLAEASAETIASNEVHVSDAATVVPTDLTTDLTTNAAADSLPTAEVAASEPASDVSAGPLESAAPPEVVAPLEVAAETPAPEVKAPPAPPVNEEEVERKIAAISLDELATELGVGKLLLEDLIRRYAAGPRSPRGFAVACLPSRPEKARRAAAGDGARRHGAQRRRFRRLR